MAKPRYEYCQVAEIRGRVEEQLPKLSASKTDDETPAEFWSRVERAGLLHMALALYDEIAATRTQTRRETKKEFDQRIDREGRRGEVERARAEMLESGLSQRETQAELVKRFQPREGTKTRAWETPDPWQKGRLFKRKADQQNVMELTNGQENEDQENEDEDLEVAEAQNRRDWAERRRDERQALRNARLRAKAAMLEQARHSRPAKQSAPKPFAGRCKPKVAVPSDGAADRMVI